MKIFKTHTRINDNQEQYELDYINDNNIDSVNMYKFQPNLYNQLINNRQFEEAYEYGNKFKRNNADEDRDYKMQLYNLRREGRKESYFYSKLQQNPDMMYQAEFYRNVFVNNGLSNLVGRNDIGDNPYAKEFIDAKKRIGSTIDENGNITQEATKLSVTFKPKGSSWFLTDWLTGVDEDVDYLELFYNQSGLTEQQLKANGIRVSKNYGNTTITFEKSNPIANKILYGLDFKDAYNVRSAHSNLPTWNLADTAPVIKSYDNNGKEIPFTYDKSKTIEYAAKIDQLSNLSNFRTMIEDAKFTNTKAEEFVSKEDGAYKGFAIPISEEEIKKINIDQALHILQPTDMKIYSTAYNEGDDRTLRFVEQVTDDNDDNRKVNLMDYVKANSDRAHYAYANYGDEIGMLITIDPYNISDTESKKLDKNMELQQGYNGKEIRVFIPGLYTESAEKAINDNSQIRAERESNDMQRYGYGYKLYNNREIMYDGNGSFVYQDDYKKIPQDEAIRLIHKSQLIEDSQFLKYEHINNNNKIYNYANFDNHAKHYAISAAMSLNPGILQEEYTNNNIIFVDRQGNQMTTKDIFDKKGGGAAVLEKYSQSMNSNTLKFYKDCFDVYMAMIADANNYE